MDIEVKVKDDVAHNKYGILKVFFEEWIDDMCDCQVQYKGTIGNNFKVIFDRPEDAVILRLIGIPSEFENYIEIVY